jgi:hypothetical protein
MQEKVEEEFLYPNSPLIQKNEPIYEKINDKKTKLYFILSIFGFILTILSTAFILILFYLLKSGPVMFVNPPILYKSQNVMILWEKLTETTKEDW